MNMKPTNETTPIEFLSSIREQCLMIEESYLASEDQLSPAHRKRLQQRLDKVEGLLIGIGESLYCMGRV